MEEIRTYSTNTDINPEPYKPAFILINPDAKEDYLLDGRYVVRAPRRGRWVETTTEDPCYYACSECGRQVDVEENYCPNCGAKMEGEINGYRN